ncbi:MAG: hypothetical protein KAT91_02140, partial [Candidatus Aenigmarchaeota archaeon]|nr:hypothetical protein [Candidatus Aenigmarchaeota archaeon]
FETESLLDVEDQIMYGLLLAISANQNQSVLESHNLYANLTEAVGRKVEEEDVEKLIHEGIIKRVEDELETYLVFGDNANEYLHPSTLEVVWQELTPFIRKCGKISSFTSQQTPLKNHSLWILASSPTKKMWLSGYDIYREFTEKNLSCNVVGVDDAIHIEEHVAYSKMNMSAFLKNEHLISRGETFYKKLAGLLYSNDTELSMDEFNFSNNEWDELDEQYNFILLDDKTRTEHGIENAKSDLKRIEDNLKKHEDNDYLRNQYLVEKRQKSKELDKLYAHEKAISEKKLIIHSSSCPYGLDGDKCRRSLRLGENLGSCYFDLNNCRVEFTPFYKGVYITPKVPVVYLNFEEMDEIMHILKETHNLSTKGRMPKGERVLNEYSDAGDLMFFEFDMDKMHPPYDKTRYFLPAKTIRSIYRDQLKSYGK